MERSSTEYQTLKQTDIFKQFKRLTKSRKIIEYKNHRKIIRYKNIPWSDLAIFKIAEYYQTNEKTLNDQSLSDALNWISTKITSEKNPYILQSVPDITLKAVDYACTHLEPHDKWYIKWDDPIRVEKLIDIAFDEKRIKGTNYLTEEEYIAAKTETMTLLLNNAPKPNLVNVDFDVLKENVQNIKRVKKVEYQIDGKLITGYMLDTAYDRNKKLATLIINKLQQPNTSINESVLNNILDNGVADPNDQTKRYPLSEQRKMIVRTLIEKPISILNGPAGTGKSTSMNGVVNYLRQIHAKIVQCAWTSKAAINLSNATNEPAGTIMSMTFQMGKKNKLKDADYIIIDEISMVPESALLTILKQAKPTAHIIMIGDKAQLPSVKSVGALVGLTDYLKNHQNAINWQELTKIHRQNGGLLLEQITKIRQQQVPTKYPKQITTDDNSIIYQPNSNTTQIAHEYVNIQNNTPNDVTIITNRNYDVNTLNNAIQNIYAKNRTQSLTVQKYSNNKVFYVGDKVVINQNKYHVFPSNFVGSNDVANGMIGTVTNIVTHPDDKSIKGLEITMSNNIQVNFFPKNALTINSKLLHQYGYQDSDHMEFASLDTIELGYAMTVHKAQGSTIDYVMIYLCDKQNKYLDRQWLYTAYTRGKHVLVISTTDINADWLAPIIERSCYTNMRSNLGYELIKQSSGIKMQNVIDDENAELEEIANANDLKKTAYANDYTDNEIPDNEMAKYGENANTDEDDENPMYPNPPYDDGKDEYDDFMDDNITPLNPPIMYITKNNQLHRAITKNDIIQEPIKTYSQLDVKDKTILAITDQSRAYYINLDDALPEMMGNIIRILPINLHDQYVMMATKNGQISKMSQIDFTKLINKNKPIIRLKNQDKLQDIAYADDNEEIIITSSNGKITRNRVDNYTAHVSISYGNRAINLTDNMTLNNIAIVNPNQEILVISKQGYGKRLNVRDLPLQKKGAKGVDGNNTHQTINIKTNDPLTLLSNQGDYQSLNMSDIPYHKRNTKGSKLIELTPDSHLL